MSHVSQDLAWLSYARTLRLRQRSTATITDYAYSYRMLTAFLGKPASEACRLEIEDWLTTRLTQVSTTRVAQDQLNLRIFYTWALREEIISTHPMERIPRIKAEVTPRRVMDDAELQALFKACKGNSFNDVRDAAILRTLTLIGTPRMGELTTMTTDSVDLVHDLLTLTGKTGTRAIPMGDSAALAMERYLRARAKHRLTHLPALWLGKKGGLQRTGMKLILARRVKAAGLSGRIFPHLFRHTTAAKASAAGMSDSMMETLYGWADGSTMTRVYGRATRAQRAQDAARKLLD
jgi:integrase/recombinase XerD